MKKEEIRYYEYQKNKKHNAIVNAVCNDMAKWIEYNQDEKAFTPFFVICGISEVQKKHLKGDKK